MRRIFLIWVCLTMAAAVMAQEGHDRSFVKITHAPGYTVAIDSTGKAWIYDYEKGDFVPEDEYEKTAGSAGDSGPEDVILPPEIRCTNIIKGDITEIFKDVVVGIDDRVEGSITSGKDITVKGLVTGNVLSYRRVIVERTGEVRGDVVAREIVREPGGRIIGERTEVPFPERLGIEMPRIRTYSSTIGGIFVTGFFIFICAITIALVPRHLGRVLAKVEEETVKSFFWGVLAWFLILPIFVLLIITIVGIPIALLIYPFALIAAFILGYVAVTVFIGSKLCPIMGWFDKSIYVRSFVGVVALAILRVLAGFLGAIGLDSLSNLFGVLYAVVAFIAITLGLGAVVTSRFGTRPKPAGADGGPSPEVPAAPMVKPPPPPRTDIFPPREYTPPPPVPPPPPKSENATDEG